MHMPFRLKNALVSFMPAMVKVLDECEQFLSPYIDYIIIFLVLLGMVTSVISVWFWMP